MRGWPSFGKSLKVGSYATHLADNNEAVERRVKWCMDPWRRAVFEHCELGKEDVIYAEALKMDIKDACHIPRTHEDDGVFCLYVQKQKGEEVSRMDQADADMFEVLVTSNITNKLEKGVFLQRPKIIEFKFIIEKGMVIIGCANQQSLEIVSMVVKAFSWPTKYKVSMSAFTETYQLKFAFPSGFKYESSEKLVNQLKVNNRPRFDFLEGEEFSGKPDVRGNHLVWVVTVNQKQAEDCLKLGEIFHYALGSGFVFGYKMDCPVLTVSMLCQCYRRTLREIESVNVDKLRKEIADQVRQIPSLPVPESRSWDLVEKTESVDDPEDIKNYRAKLAQILPTWKASVEDTSSDMVADYTWKMIDNLALNAEQKETKYLNKYDDKGKFLRYPGEPDPLDLPKVDGKECRIDEYVNAINEVYHDMPPDQIGCTKDDLRVEVAEEKIRILEYHVQLKRKQAWLAARRNNDIDEHMKRDSAKRSREFARKKRDREEALRNVGMSEPDIQNAMKEDDIEKSKPKLKYITQQLLATIIAGARDSKKRKRASSPGTAPKRKSTDMDTSSSGAQKEPPDP